MEISDKDKRFRCLVCSKLFSRSTLLRDHLSIHSGIKPFKCSKCNMNFRKKRYLKNHMSKHTGQYLYNCSICGKGMNSKYFLKEHLKIHTGNKPYRCKVCSRDFFFFSTYKRHINTAYHANVRDEEKDPDRSVNICPICCQGFKEVISLRIHMRIHADKNPFSCKHCGKSFKFKKHLVSHLKDHNFQCTKCPIQFKNFEAYREHVKKHETGKLHICSVCEKTFTTNSNLKIHERIHNPNSAKFFCKHCNSEFSRLGNLSRHLKNNTGENSYPCTDCSAIYETGCLLKQHKMTHNENYFLKLIVSSDVSFYENQKYMNGNAESDTNSINNYQCSLCSKIFKSKKTFFAHQVTHSEMKRFRCEHCNKGFRYKRSLGRHRLTHTKERPFKCTECSNGFFSSFELQMHKNRHFGIKPFKCEKCNKGFYKKYNLDVHLRIHFGIKLYSCEYCETQFSQAIGLKRHLKKFTGNEPYLCGFCPSQFETECLVNKHVSSAHKRPTSSKVLPVVKTESENADINFVNIEKESVASMRTCKYCEAQFSRATSLRRHLKKFTGNKPYLCGFCPSQFETECLLNKHVASTHKRSSSSRKVVPVVKTEPENVDIDLVNIESENIDIDFVKIEPENVDDNFVESSNLYQCSYCDNKFSHLSIYKKHLNYHNNEKPLKCCRCFRRFSNGKQLLMHDCLKATQYEKQFWDFIHSWGSSFDLKDKIETTVKEV